MPKKIEISHKSIIFSVLFLLLLWFLYFIRDVLLQFFLALLISAILNPLVTRISMYRIPRGVSILLTYLVIFGVVGYSFAGVIPPLIEQTGSFTSNIPVFIENSGVKSFVDENILKEFLSFLSSIPGQLARVVVGIFSNILSVITVLIFSFYFLLSWNKLEASLSGLFGENSAKKAAKTITLIEKRLGGWARGQIVLMFIVGLSPIVILFALAVGFRVSGLIGIIVSIPLIIIFQESIKLYLEKK